VHENFFGQIVWQGEVEVFDLHGHPKAKRCHGWSHIHGEKDDKERFVAVLEIPPVDSASKAVLVQIVEGCERNQMKRPTLFRIILVLLGMISLIFALLFLMFGFIAMSDIPKEVGHDRHEIFFVLFGLLSGAISIYLFCGAPHISRFARSKKHWINPN
jgi:hypothetical protein